MKHKQLHCKLIFSVVFSSGDETQQFINFDLVTIGGLEMKLEEVELYLYCAYF